MSTDSEKNFNDTLTHTLLLLSENDDIFAQGKPFHTNTGPEFCSVCNNPISYIGPSITTKAKLFGNVCRRCDDILFAGVVYNKDETKSNSRYTQQSKRRYDLAKLLYFKLSNIFNDDNINTFANISDDGMKEIDQIRVGPMPTMTMDLLSFGPCIPHPKCQWILTKGRDKGKVCERNVYDKDGTYCSSHIKCVK